VAIQLAVVVVLIIVTVVMSDKAVAVKNTNVPSVQKSTQK
jgi:hypothetical protein